MPLSAKPPQREACSVQALKGIEAADAPQRISRQREAVSGPTLSALILNQIQNGKRRIYQEKSRMAC